jgi:flagellar basal body-associated protein FliL
MKKIIIIVVAILLLAGGGFAAWKFLLSGKPPAEAPAAEEGAQPAGPPFVELAPFVIPVTRGDRVVKYTSLTVKLEVVDAAAKQKVEKFLPYVRDAFLTKMLVTLSRGDPDEGYDMEKLRRQLMAESERVLGPGLIKDILITAAAERTPPQ